MHPFRSTTRRGLSCLDMLTILAVIGILLALLLPAVQASREAARRMACANNLKMIGLALHNYHNSNRAFPPGIWCTSKPIKPANQYDVWTEAGKVGKGHRGTSFFLAILPYMEAYDVAKAWQYGYGISDKTAGPGGDSNFSLASTDIRGLYCPSRRTRVRPGRDNTMMLSPEWKGGGTDYGGCAGRHAAFTKKTGYNLCDATMFYEPNYYPDPFKGKKDDIADKRWGFFGRVNKSTKFSDIRDGTSNTIMTGELQRITGRKPGSKDGWAIGGPATLFTNGAMFAVKEKDVVAVASPKDGGLLMNNDFFGSPGSDHAGGANFGIADGSVKFLSTSIDPRIIALLGSMADRVAFVCNED